MRTMARNTEQRYRISAVSPNDPVFSDEACAFRAPVRDVSGLVPLKEYILLKLFNRGNSTYMYSSIPCRDEENFNIKEH